MKKLWFVAATLLLTTITQAQLLKRIGDRAKQKVNQKIDQKVDKTIDDAIDGKKKPKNSTDSKTGKSGGAVGADAGVGTGVGTGNPSGTGSGNPVANGTESGSGNPVGTGVGNPTGTGSGNPVGNGTGAKSGNPAGTGTGNPAGTGNPTGTGSGNPTGNGTGNPTTLKSYSKFDFVPGDKVISFEDFQQDAIGDFPAKWNTNSSGEVVTVEGQTGHWLMLKKKGRFVPEYINNLPENFTMQFDIIVNEKFNYYSESLDLLILSGENTGKVFEYSFIGTERRSGVKISFDPTNAGNNGGICHIRTFQDGSEVINNDIATKTFDAFAGKTKVNVSIWRQKQRIRVYLNEEKVFDLPRAFAADKKYNTVLFDIWNAMANDEDRYLVNNIKLAVGAPDTRSKLITEGKFVTSGILFDVNSDHIRPESYGVLKDIANVLTENPEVKVKVIGHTDSDGDDKSNMDLSKRRAEAVKIALNKEFGINDARMETDGKGELQPADKNDTPVGKANNRRVEFIKL